MKFLLTLTFLLAWQNPTVDWGFFAHARINELAVYTLPPEMKLFFSPNQQYLKRHAIDADKRRYASPFEAVRHYIDLDHHGTYPYTELPRQFRRALRENCTLTLINRETEKHKSLHQDSFDSLSLKFWFDTLAMDYYYEEQWLVPLDASFGLDTSKWQILVEDHFSEHGILPYNLVWVYNALVRAFVDMDAQRICRYAADLGHYIGDACVPLHTHSNYNGQKTGQKGIHAFWESRLPELYADEEYDPWVGQCSYINDVSEIVWTIILESNALVEEVLEKERSIRASMPDELEYEVLDRNGLWVQKESTLLSSKYHKALDGMVEARFRRAIHATGSMWYSAWVDAGMPYLENLEADFSLKLARDKKRFFSPRRHIE